VGKHQLALPQLLSLEEDLQRFSLDEWEPRLSLEAVRQLYLCRRSMTASLKPRPPDVDKQLDELYQRICRLDITAALAVEH
jgi:hypothetical protein